MENNGNITNIKDRKTEALKLFEKLKTDGRKADGEPSFLVDWEADEYLGGGSFGNVFKAYRGKDADRQEFAIKIIKTKRESYNLNFDLVLLYEESRAMTELADCPNIVNIRDRDTVYCYSDEEQKICHYLVIRMDLLSPVSKDNAPVGKMSVRKVLRLADDMCSALSYCHKLDPPIIHNDIKPDNIFIDSNGDYRLGDFGAANLNLGSNGFRAPEAYENQHNQRTDIYSLGCTLYALFNNGLPPFFEDYFEYFDNERACSWEEYLFTFCKDRDVPPLKKVPRRIMKIITRMCSFSPDRRYSSAEEVKKALGVRRPDTSAFMRFLRIWRKNITALLTVFIIAAALAVSSYYYLIKPRYHYTDDPSDFTSVSSDDIPEPEFSENSGPSEPEPQSTREKKLYRIPFAPDPLISSDSFGYVRETYSYNMYTQHVRVPRYWSSDFLVSYLLNTVEDNNKYCFAIVTLDEVVEISGTREDAVSEIKKIGGSSFTGIAVTEPRFRGTNACYGLYIADTYADEYFSSLPEPTDTE